MIFFYKNGDQKTVIYIAIQDHMGGKSGYILPIWDGWVVFFLRGGGEGRVMTYR